MYRRNIGHSRVKNLFKFSSSKMSTVFTVESSLEFDTCFHLEFSPLIKSYEAQPEGFYYEFAGKQCPYTPDFRVVDQNGNASFLEIKPSDNIADPDFLQRFPVKQQRAIELSTPLRLVTEKQIKVVPLLGNLKLLDRYKGFHSSIPLHQQLLNLVQKHDRVSLSRLVVLTSAPPGDISATVLSLLAKGLINSDLTSQEFDLSSVVSAITCDELVVSNQIGMFEDEFANLPQLIPPTHSDTLPNSLPATFDCLSDELKSEANHRLNYLRWIGSRLNGGWTEKNLKPLLEEATSVLPPPAPNWRTLARWHKTYIQNGKKLLSLIPNHQEKGNSKSRLPSNDEVYFDQAVLIYLTREKPSIASAYQQYSDTVLLNNLTLAENPIKALSRRAFYNRVQKLPAYQVMKSRQSDNMANVEFQAFSSHIRPTRVMERVEIDHTPMDLILLDDKLLVPLGRPSLTMLVDAYSHCIVGFNLNFNQPNYVSAANAIHNSITKKDYVKSKSSFIEHDWPCYGKPETLVVDNGAEFWSANLEQACLELGINIQYNPVKKPWLKPLIERMFGTINCKLLGPIPGKTFSSIIERGDYNPQKDAIMRFSTFLEIFHRWIIDVYHYEPDSRLRYIPNLMWESGVEKFPPAATFGDDLATLEVILSISVYCTHRQGGVQLNHLHYNSDEFASYRMKYSVQSKGKQKVLVKLNPMDISYIFVFIGEIRRYLRVPCIDPEGYTVGLTLQEHQVNVKLQRDFISKKIDLVGLAKARSYINERIKNETAEVRKTLRHNKIKGIKRVAQYRGVGSRGEASIATESKFTSTKEINAEMQQTGQPQNKDDWDDFISGLEPY